jgi:hypothetical protein
MSGAAICPHCDLCFRFTQSILLLLAKICEHELTEFLAIHGILVKILRPVLEPGLPQYLVGQKQGKGKRGGAEEGEDR